MIVKARHILIYVIEEPGTSLLVTRHPGLRHYLRTVLIERALLLWYHRGGYAIVPLDVIENALTHGCESDISWTGPVKVIPWRLGEYLLQYAQELCEPPGSEEPGPDSEGDQG